MQKIKKLTPAAFFSCIKSVSMQMKDIMKVTA
jgi:hypothetical protein